MRFLLILVLFAIGAYFARPYVEPQLREKLMEWGLLEDPYRYSSDIPLSKSQEKKAQEILTGMNQEPVSENTEVAEEEEKPSPKIHYKDAVVGDHYIEPEFLSLEEITQNWQRIPKRAFPRRVVIKADAQFKLGAGSTKRSVGTEVLAVGTRKGQSGQSQLLLQLSEKSSARALLPLAQTDFQERLSKAYADWKVAVQKRDQSRWQEEQIFLEAE